MDNVFKEIPVLDKILKEEPISIEELCSIGAWSLVDRGNRHIISVECRDGRVFEFFATEKRLTGIMWDFRDRSGDLKINDNNLMTPLDLIAL